MRFDEPDVREAYRCGARDCYESILLRTQSRQSREIESWLEELEQWAIEVILQFSDGRQRRCCFVRPQALASFGDTLGDSGIRLHYGAAHMIVVDAELNGGLILQVLRQIEAVGELEHCSLPC